MLTSGQQVVDLLRKYMQDRTPLHVYLRSADGTTEVKLSGFVNGLPSDGILFSDGTLQGERSSNWMFVGDPASAQSFWYGEARELNVPETERARYEEMIGETVLKIDFASGALLRVFTRKDLSIGP